MDSTGHPILENGDLEDRSLLTMISDTANSNFNNRHPEITSFDPAPPNAFADAVWRCVRSQLTAPVLASSTPIAHIPLSEIYYKMPDSDQKWVLAAFSDIVNCPSQWAVVPAYDKAVLHLVGYGPGGQDIDYVPKSDKTIARAAVSKVPRPLNAFILYRMDYQELIKEQHPGIKNNDVSRIIGQQWKAESKEIRDHYSGKAKRAKMEHLLLYPDYQYKPRRPEEKKRRMTKNKQRKLLEKLAAEENKARVSEQRIDPSILADVEMGYVLNRQPDSQPCVGGFQMNMDDSCFDWSPQYFNMSEEELAIIPWPTITNEVNLIQDADLFEGDYSPQSGITPGVYLLN